MAISSPLQSKVPTGSVKTIKKFQTILLNRTKVRREIFQQQTILQNRRIENERRKQREDELEAPNLVTKPRGAAGLIAGSAKGFFERLVGFLSYLTAGWIINNLPTWISMGKEFIARTQQMGKILGGFITNSTDIFKNFTKLLGAGLTNLMKFDFLDTSGRVSTAFDELNLSVENWGAGFEDVIKLITTPLTEGIASGEDARPLGTENTDEGAYERTAPYSGSGRTIGGIHKEALDIIAGPESGGNYNAMNQGTDAKGNILGSGDSKKVIGQSLTSMTIGEVIDRQNQSKYPRGGKNDKGIHAAGKYQMIGNTLPGAMKSAGLSEKDLFSPENQDKMGLALLKERGIQPWTSGGSKYSTKEMEIVEQARKTPVSTSVPSSQISQTPSGKGGKIVEYLTGDRTHKRYRADHAAGNYHDHVAFDSQKTRDAAMAFLRGKGWTIGSINTGRHADGSYHYSNQAFDIPFYPNQSKKGVTDDAKGETKLSSRLRSDLISGGFGGPQLGGSSTSSPAPATTQSIPTPAQISSTGTPQNPQISQSLAPERTGPTVIVSQNPSSPARQMMSSGGGSSGGGSSQISEFTLLNNFIKNKLLLDLAYL